MCYKRILEVSVGFVPMLNGISSAIINEAEYHAIFAHMESARHGESGKLRCRMDLGYDAGTCTGMTWGIARINRQLWSVVSEPLG
jgi:hypothetical protein